MTEKIEPARYGGGRRVEVADGGVDGGVQLAIIDDDDHEGASLELTGDERRELIALLQRPDRCGDTVECDDRRWIESQDDWANGILLDAPESWGGEESADSIALSYVATLEARMDAAGISREKWIEE